jgi:hypothetical protein
MCAYTSVSAMASRTLGDVDVGLSLHFWYCHLCGVLGFFVCIADINHSASNGVKLILRVRAVRFYCHLGPPNKFRRPYKKQVI